MEYQYHGRTAKDETTLEWSWPNPLRQTMRAARAGTREGSWALGSPEGNGGGVGEGVSRIINTACFMLLNLGFVLIWL